MVGQRYGMISEAGELIPVETFGQFGGRLGLRRFNRARLPSPMMPESSSSTVKEKAPQIGRGCAIAAGAAIRQ